MCQDDSQVVQQCLNVNNKKISIDSFHYLLIRLQTRNKSSMVYLKCILDIREIWSNLFMGKLTFLSTDRYCMRVFDGGGGGDDDGGGHF